MFLSRSLVGAAIALVVALPAARAQGTYKTLCNDGTSVSATGGSACDMHGGIHKNKISLFHRSSSAKKQAEPAHVAQAGTPADKKRYEERRGWRWQHRDAKHEERRDEKHARVRCRDGRFEKSKGNSKNVCKHHGGLAH